MTLAKKSRQSPYPLRMPPDLKKWLERVADQEGRSTNTEIVRRLQQSRAQQEAKEMAA